MNRQNEIPSTENVKLHSVCTLSTDAQKLMYSVLMLCKCMKSVQNTETLHVSASPTPTQHRDHERHLTCAPEVHVSLPSCLTALPTKWARVSLHYTT